MAVRYSAQSGYWTDPSTWQGGTVPQAGDQVVIQSGHTVTYDVVEGSQYDVELGTANNSLDVDIYGTLRFDTNATQNLRLRFKGYVRVRNGGRFEIGNDDTPFPVKATIQKTASNGQTMFLVEDTARISIVGTPNLPSDGQGGYKIYTTLAQDASSGASSIRVVDDLNWEVGDVIAMPRSIGFVTSPPTNFSATVNNITRNTDGTCTLTLSATLPQVYVAGTPVVKCNRKITFVDPNTSTTYNFVFNRVSNYSGILEAAKWFAVQRNSGNLYGIFRLSAMQTTVIEYVSVLPLSSTTVGTIFYLYSDTAAPAPTIRRCVTTLYYAGGANHYFEECVIGTACLMQPYAPVVVRNSLLFSTLLNTSGSTAAYFENCICYNPVLYGNLRAVFKNCTFYGLGALVSANITQQHHVTFLNCRFYRSFDGSTAPQLGWGSYTVSQRYLGLYNCQFYDSWAEPSTFDTYYTMLQFRGAHPLPIVRFVNKQTTSGSVAEQVFRAGGIITSNDTDIPSELQGVQYSYDFSPRSQYFPLICDIPLPPGSTIKIAHKYINGDISARIQIISLNDAEDWPTLITPLQELTLTRETSWVIITITNSSNQYRIARIHTIRNSSTGVWRFAFAVSHMPTAPQQSPCVALMWF